MTQYPLPTPAPLFWVYLFVVLCYAAALGCVYHATRVGVLEYYEVRRHGHPRRAQVIAGVTWIVFFAVSVILCWGLESWAFLRTPFYVYDLGFPDPIGPVPFANWMKPERYHPCAEFVQQLIRGNREYNMIPLSIPLLEASLAYAGIWIGIRMGAGFRLTPFIAALIMVDIDALLDPVASAGRACSGVEPTAIGHGFGRPGLGLWTWYVPHLEIDGPIRGFAGIADWFDVPLFNYAAWWAAPVVLGSLVMIAQYLQRAKLWPEKRAPEPRPVPPSGRDALWFGALGLIALIGFGVLVAYLMSPSFPLGRGLQWTLLIAVLLYSVWRVVRSVQQRNLTAIHQVDTTLTRPLYVFLLFSVGAMLCEGVFFQRPGVILVAVVTLLVAALFVWWPYPLDVLRFCQRLLDADRFLRIHYVAFSLMLVLLGAFALGLLPDSSDYALYLDGWSLAALLGVAICFHIWAFVLNDVIDLEIDKKQPRRRQDPLVQDRIARSSALGLAVACVPTSLLLTFLMQAPLEAYEILVLGIALMAAYNQWGKRCPFPPLTDFVQASAWACLPLFAATAVEPVIRAQGGVIQEGRWLLVWAIAVWGGGFILIINGIHGGLRDLANDRDFDARTTALHLGAEVVSQRQSKSNLRIAAFAYTVHAAMFVLPTVFLWSYAVPGTGRVVAAVALYGLGAISLLAMWRVVRPHERKRDRWIGYHLLILLLPVPLAFSPFLATDRTALYLLLAAFFVPLLPLHEIVSRVLRVIHPQIADKALEPPRAQTTPAPAPVAAS